MAVSCAADKMVWSQTSRTLAETIVSHTFPVLIKVEKTCPDDVEYMFSSGDLLKLDSIEWIPSVRACRVIRKLNSSSSEFIYTEDTVSIPLGYKGLLQLINLNAGITVYSNVDDLLSARPRYVRTIEPVVQNGNVVVGEKCDIEITIRDGQAVCVYTERSYILDEDAKLNLLQLPDNSLYTLQELYDRYPFPQYVSFIQNKQTETENVSGMGTKQKMLHGEFELREFVHQDLVVGSCNFACEALHGGRVTRDYQSVVIVKPDGVTAKHMNVVVCEDENTMVSDSLIQRGTGYHQSILDHISIVDVIILNHPHLMGAIDRNLAEKSGKDQTTVTDDEQVPKSDETHQDYTDFCLYEVDNHFYTVPVGPEEKNEVEQPTESNTESHATTARALFSKKYEDKIKALKFKLATVVQQKTSKKSINDAIDDEGDDYIIPENIAPKQSVKHVAFEVPKSLQKLVLKLSSNREHHYTTQQLNLRTATADQGQARSNVCVFNVDVDKDNVDIENVYDYVENVHDYVELKDTDQPDKIFASLTVTGLVNLLTTCGLDNIADICRQEKVDGLLFATLTDDDLREIFSASRLQIKKIRLAQNRGWTPKR